MTTATNNLSGAVIIPAEAAGPRSTTEMRGHHRRSPRHSSDPTPLNKFVDDVANSPNTRRFMRKEGEGVKSKNRSSMVDNATPTRADGKKTKIRHQGRTFTALFFGLTLSFAFQIFGPDVSVSCSVAIFCSHCQSHSSIVRDGGVVPVAMDVPPCSYEQLYRAYHNSTAPFTTYTMSGNESSQCWNLDDEILRIDADSFVDRDNMLRLGGGKMGVVYRAIVQLDLRKEKAGGQVATGTCTVAVKTDTCIIDEPSSAASLKIEGSCVHRNAYFAGNASTLGAEYAAALVFHAARQGYVSSMDGPDGHIQSQDVLSGLIPIWGVVEDVAHPLPSRKPRHDLAKSPLVSEPTVRGVIMPFIEGFVPVSALSRTSLRTFASPDASAVARSLLPAARSLRFVADLGGALGDVLMKNAGVVLDKEGQVTQSFATLFDYSKFSLLDRPCTLSSRRACNFCPDASSFPMSSPDGTVDHFQFEAFNTSMSSKDLVGFKSIAKQLLKHCEPNKARGQLIRALAEAENFAAVIKALEKHQGHVSSAVSKYE